MSLITIHWRAPPKGGDFLYVVVYMRRALALCSLHDEDIFYTFYHRRSRRAVLVVYYCIHQTQIKRLCLYTNIP